MKSLGLSRKTLFISIAAAWLTACGASQPLFGAPGAMPQSLVNLRTRLFTLPAPGPARGVTGLPGYKMSNSLLYVVNSSSSSYEFGDVAVYDAKANDPSPIAIITDGLLTPDSDCIDRGGTLYVADQNGWVAEYARGQTTLLQDITEGSGTPVACTIDGKGNLWVAALSAVDEYLKGSNQPYKIITDGVAYANSVVFDHAGNMYVGNSLAWEDQQSNIQVYPPGSNSPSRTITDGVVWPVGTAVDAKNVLYVTNITDTNEQCGDVEEYRAGESHPFRTITDGIAGPLSLAFNVSDRLYELNGGFQGCVNQRYDLVLEFLQGSIRPGKRTITTLFNPGGIAYYRPPLP